MLAHKDCHRYLNPHSLLCQVQSSPLVKLYVFAGRGEIQGEAWSPTSKLPATVLEHAHNHPYPDVSVLK